jgi:hypothetical protein
MRTLAALLLLLSAFLVAVVAFQRGENKNIRRELAELRAATVGYWRVQNEDTTQKLAAVLLDLELEQ